MTRIIIIYYNKSFHAAATTISTSLLLHYIHSNRGALFVSQELVEYLTSKGIATSRTTPYNSRGNGQTARFVLRDALHSIRSLLCISTNATPHERLFSHLVILFLPG